MKKWLVLTFSLLVLLANPMFGRNGYIRIDGGGVLSGEFSSQIVRPDLQVNGLGRSWLYGGGVGYYVKDVRFELRALERNSMRYQYFNETNDTKDLTVGNLQNFTLFLGGYYQLYQLNYASPYIGAGGGFSRNIINDSYDLTGIYSGASAPLGSVAKNTGGFFLSTGVLLRFIPCLEIDICGAYSSLGSVGPILVDRAFLTNIATFEVSLGLMWRCF